jgi:hypothetical protein
VIAGAVRRGPELSLPLGLSTLPLALIVALAGTGAVIAGGWADGTGVALVVVAAAVVEAALVARSSAGRVAAALAAPVLGVLVIVPLTLRDIPVGREAGWRALTDQYASALTQGIFASTDWPFVVGLCGLLWLAAFWLSWMAIRERHAVLALLPWISVLAVNALNAPSIEHVAVPEVICLAAALMLLTRVQLSALARGWRRERVIALPGTESRYLRVGAGAVALLLLLALVVPPVSTRDVSSFLSRLGGSGHGGQTSAGRAGGARGGSVQFAPSTVPGQPLRNDPRPVLSFTTDGKGSTYLAVVADTVFQDGNWYPDDTGVSRVDTKAGDLPRDPQGVGAPTQRVHVRLVLSSGATGAEPLGLFAGDPVASGSPGLAIGQPASGTSMFTVDRFVLSHAQASLTTTGANSIATTAQLRNAGRNYPAWTQAYTAMTGGGGSATVELAQIGLIARQWTAGRSDPYDQAVAIEDHLRDTSPGNFAYNLAPPPTPNGEWPIVYFLTQSHSGYCQYFASAMGAMLRSLGIPTRLISGYGPGSTDQGGDTAASAVTSTRHTVTTSDAHIWPEAYFPNYGWIAFEPTPDGFYTPLSRGGGSAAPAPASAQPSPTPAAAPTPAPTPVPSSSAAGGAAPHQGIPAALVATLVLLLVATGALAVAVRWLARPRRIADVWRRVDLLAAGLGVRRQPAETHTDYVGRIIAALPPDTTTLRHRDGSAPPGPRPVRAGTAAALLQIASWAGKEAFSRRGLEGREAVQWRRAWDRVRRHAPLVVWRGLLQRSTR